MRDDCLDLRRQREFIVITSGCGKGEKGERGDREGNTRQPERHREKTTRDICLPDSQWKQCALQQGDNRERERERRWERGGEAEQVDMSQHVAWGKNCGSREEK